MGFWRVNRSNPCPVCGHTDWCGYTEKVTICMRVPGDKPAQGRYGQYAGYIHKLDGCNLDFSPIDAKKELPKADQGTCHAVYNALLKSP